MNSPWSKPDFKPSNTRRSRTHNYYAPGCYHITICKHPDAPYFGMKPNTRDRVVPLCALGMIIDMEIRDMPKYHPILEVIEHIVMPDHIHLLLRISATSEKHLGYYITNLKSAVTKRWRSLEGGAQSYPVFADGYNDKIMYPWRNLETVRNYIRTNPYRLAVRLEKPEYFQRATALEIDSHKVQAYGNLFLLRNPFKEQVVVHRRNSQSENDKLRERWLYSAANGGVLVSPFISPAEKTIRKEAEEAGGKIILITNITMGERYKPSGSDFALCEEGRLLIITLPSPSPLSRQACLAMNRLAEAISG